MPQEHLNREAAAIWGLPELHIDPALGHQLNVEALPLCLCPRCALHLETSVCPVPVAAGRSFSALLLPKQGMWEGSCLRLGQMWPNVSSAVCPHLQMSRFAVPAQLTWPGHSAQCSGVGGREPCPAISPVGVGSFPASSHMTVAVYFCLWPPCLWRPPATSG